VPPKPDAIRVPSLDEELQEPKELSSLLEVLPKPDAVRVPLHGLKLLGSRKFGVELKNGTGR